MSYDGSYSSGGNDTSFAATFAREHARQGAGHTFDWNGKLYTTDRADGRDLRAERMARDNSTSSSMHSSFGMHILLLKILQQMLKLIYIIFRDKNCIHNNNKNIKIITSHRHGNNKNTRWK